MLRGELAWTLVLLEYWLGFSSILMVIGSTSDYTRNVHAKIRCVEELSCSIKAGLPKTLYISLLLTQS
jgi:hypothetical protein